ncbi:MAG: energy transducer TonB [Vicinamibacterales bacterium]
MSSEVAGQTTVDPAEPPPTTPAVSAAGIPRMREAPLPYAGTPPSPDTPDFVDDPSELPAPRSTAAAIPVKQVEPIYPPAARQAGVEGLVVVTYSLGPDGRPRNLKITKSIPLLDEAVLTALRQWEYMMPTGEPSQVLYRYNAEFSLH